MFPYRRWVVKSKRRGGGDGDDEVYDAVVICNGHYSEPRIADLPGIEEWPGKQIHSHNYRLPDPLRDQIVVLIGSAASADDISRDIARVAKEVHIASRSAQIDEIGKILGHDNICLHSMIKSVHGDGTVAFSDGDKIFADVILHCTGYKFHFPFLETNNAITVEDNRVGPLYQHVFPPTLAPWLSFVGLPWKVVPFPQFELQSKWIAGVLSGRIRMESADEMTADVEAFYTSLEAAEIPKRYTHQIGESQFEYDNWLAEKSNSPPIEEWREGMYFVTGQRKRSSPETYRDQWQDDGLSRLQTMQPLSLKFHQIYFLLIYSWNGKIEPIFSDMGYSCTFIFIWFVSDGSITHKHHEWNKFPILVNNPSVPSETL